MTNKRRQVRTHVWLAPDELERVEIEAQRAGLSGPGWIRSAIASFLHDGLTVIRRPMTCRRVNGRRRVEI